MKNINKLISFLFLFALVGCALQQENSTGNTVPKKGEAPSFILKKTLPVSLEKLLKAFDYKLDSYQNVVVSIEKFESDTLEKISAVMMEMKQSYKNYGLYLSIPINNFNVFDDIEKLGFKLWDTNLENKIMIFLYPNGRNIPKLNYAYTAAGVFLLRNNQVTGKREILIINEPAKNISNIICGISEPAEMPEDTVVREAQEEVGVTINKEKLQLVAVCHTVRNDQKVGVEFLYTCEDFKGTPKVDGIEVTHCAWIPLTKIKEKGVKIFDKPFYSVWQKILLGDARSKKYGEYISSSNKIYQNFEPVS